MSAEEKVRVPSKVAASPLSKSQALAEIGIPRRTYYNWVRQEQEGRNGSSKKIPWNKVKAEEEKLVIDHARASPELSPRQLALSLVDSYGI